MNIQPSSDQGVLPGHQVLTVVGGKIISSSFSSHGKFPVNGQQLMMQLDSLTSCMMDMVVTSEEVEMKVRVAKY